jgi:hypothetical protein
MQHHSAQHLISALALRDFGIKTLSWELGRRDGGSVTVELAVPPEEETGKLTELENSVNDAVRAARPILCVRPCSLPACLSVGRSFYLHLRTHARVLCVTVCDCLCVCVTVSVSLSLSVCVCVCVCVRVCHRWHEYTRAQLQAGERNGRPAN